MSYRVIDETDAPPVIQEWLKTNKQIENFTFVYVEGKSYVVITRGEKKTGGYGIKLDEVNENSKILIRVEYFDPEPDEIVIQVVTYPYIIIELNYIEKEIILIIEK